MNIRNLILTTLMTCTLFLAQAQDVKLEAGSVQANVGIGLLPTYVADATENIVPPVSANIDVFLSPNFSLGAYAAYAKASGEAIYPNAGIKETFVNETMMFGLRTTVHSNDLDGWRVYGGLTVGANIPNIDKTVEQLPGEPIRDDRLPSFSRPQGNTLLFTGFVGTKRYLNENLSVFGELGFGISLATVGAGYTF